MGAEPNQEHVTGPDKIQLEPTKQRNGHSLCLSKLGKVSPKPKVNLHMPDKKRRQSLSLGRKQDANWAKGIYQQIAKVPGGRRSRS